MPPSMNAIAASQRIAEADRRIDGAGLVEPGIDAGRDAVAGRRRWPGRSRTGRPSPSSATLRQPRVLGHPFHAAVGAQVVEQEVVRAAGCGRASCR